MSGDVSVQGRTTAALLRDRTFGPFLVGKILSACGNWVQQIASVVLMFELTQSAAMVGVVSGMLFAGPLVLSLWAGSMTDRRDRRKLLVVGRALTGVSSGVLALLIMILGVNGFGGPPVLLASVAVMGVGHALSMPAMQALTPALVPDEDLEPALAASSVAPSIARTVGPAVGAGLIALGGPGLAFLAATATHCVFVLALVWIRASTSRPGRRDAGRSGIFAGLRYLVHARTAGWLVVGIGLLAFGADPVLTLAPALAEKLGGDSELVGLFASSFGVGAVLVVVVFRTMRRWLSLRWVGVAGFLVTSVGLVIVAVTGTTAGVVVGFAINGAGFMMAMVALNTRIQQGVPDELRGRVMALWSVAFLGSRPIVAPVTGLIADLVSLAAALLLCAVIVLAASLFARVRTKP